MYIIIVLIERTKTIFLIVRKFTGGIFLPIIFYSGFFAKADPGHGLHPPRIKLLYFATVLQIYLLKGMGFLDTILLQVFGVWLIIMTVIIRIQVSEEVLHSKGNFLLVFRGLVIQNGEDELLMQKWGNGVIEAILIR
jgi:hypothetical protein